MNGSRRSTLTVPSLVNWDTWTDIPVTLPLAAGNNIVTLRRDGGDTGQVAIDSLSVPFWPAAGLYEAESTNWSTAQASTVTTSTIPASASSITWKRPGRV